MRIARYAKAIGAAIGGSVSVVGAILTNAPPESIEPQAVLLSGAVAALISGLAAYWPRNED